MSDFKRDELFATGPEKNNPTPGVANRGASFYSSHVEPDLNDEPHVYRGRRRARTGRRSKATRRRWSAAARSFTAASPCASRQTTSA